MEYKLFESAVHSKSFMNEWQIILNDVFSYETFMDYSIVPSILGKKTLSYAPLLNFTNRLSDNIDDLLELGKDNNYQIRALNPKYNTFIENDTVTMRLDISNASSQEIFDKKLHQNCRRKVRQSIKRNDFKILSGRDEKLIDDFYKIFSKVMHGHGTPVNKKEFFKELIKRINSQVFIYKLESRVVAASIILFDDDIAELYWNVIDNDFSKTQIGYFSFWNSIKYVVDEKNCKIFDFGRSSFGGATYKFKKQWGAVPIKIDILKPNQDDVYTKYELASTIWKRLPRKVVEFIGPKLCKYLEDL